MPTKQGQTRPRGGMGLTSAMRPEAVVSKPGKNGMPKVMRNRNRVTSAKPAPVSRRGK